MFAVTPTRGKLGGGILLEVLPKRIESIPVMGKKNFIQVLDLRSKKKERIKLKTFPHLFHDEYTAWVQARVQMRVNAGVRIKELVGALGMAKEHDARIASVLESHT